MQKSKISEMRNGWVREAAERECARAPLIGIRFADDLSVGGYEGVGLAEGEARAAKRPQGHAREPKPSELDSGGGWDGH